MSEFDFLYQEPSDGSADFQPDGVRGQGTNINCVLKQCISFCKTEHFQAQFPGTVPASLAHNLKYRKK